VLLLLVVIIRLSIKESLMSLRSLIGGIGKMARWAPQEENIAFWILVGTLILDKSEFQYYMLLYICYSLTRICYYLRGLNESRS